MCTLGLASSALSSDVIERASSSSVPVLQFSGSQMDSSAVFNTALEDFG